jgi:hypothetical protein
MMVVRESSSQGNKNKMTTLVKHEIELLKVPLGIDVEGNLLDYLENLKYENHNV